MTIASRYVDIVIRRDRMEGRQPKGLSSIPSQQCRIKREVGADRDLIYRHLLRAK
jgi:hypothetical protein